MPLPTGAENTAAARLVVLVATAEAPRQELFGMRAGTAGERRPVYWIEGEPAEAFGGPRGVPEGTLWNR